MIIQKVYIVGVAVLKAEDNSPIGAHRHGMKAFQFALQWMEAKIRAIHVLGPNRHIQIGKNNCNSTCQIGWQSAPVVIVKKALQTPMTEVCDHD